MSKSKTVKTMPLEELATQDVQSVKEFLKERDARCPKCLEELRLRVQNEWAYCRERECKYPLFVVIEDKVFCYKCGKQIEFSYNRDFIACKGCGRLLGIVKK